MSTFPPDDDYLAATRAISETAASYAAVARRVAERVGAVGTMVRLQTSLPASSQLLVGMEAARRMQEHADRILRPVRDMQEQVARSVGAITESIRKTATYWRELLELHERFPYVMMELGWPPPTDMPPSSMRSIVQGFEHLGASPTDAQKRAYAQTIEPEILRCYDGECLRLKIQEWRSKRLLIRRMHILEAAVTAHGRGEYVLSIPALLAQAEGIIADGFRHPGRMGSATYAEYVQRLFDSGEKGQIAVAVNKGVQAFWQGVLYTPFGHGQPITSPLSRHAVLHGGDVDYGTPERSLMAILLVDLFQGAFVFTVVDNSAVYHGGDCVALSRAKGAIRFLKNEQDALDEGRRPCHRCLPGESG